MGWFGRRRGRDETGQSGWVRPAVSAGTGPREPYGADELSGRALDLSYGEVWHSRHRYVVGPMPAGEARRRFAQGEEFVVVAGEGPLAEGDDGEGNPNNPEAEWSMWVQNDSREGLRVSVAFYDIWGSVRGIYDFAQGSRGGRSPRDDQMFLAQITTYTYPGMDRFYAEAEWVGMQESISTPDGYTRVNEYRRAQDGGVERRVLEYSGGDMSAHWEPVPQFGDWAGLTRKDRFGSPGS